MSCVGDSYTFLGQHIRAFGYECTSEIFYVFILLIYCMIITGKHKIDVLVSSKRRKLLLLPIDKRNICSFLFYEFSQTFVGILFVIFISSNNIGFLITTLIAHTLGSIWVLKTCESDSCITVEALANAVDRNEAPDQLNIIEEYIRQKIKIELQNNKMKHEQTLNL